MAGFVRVLIFALFALSFSSVSFAQTVNFGAENEHKKSDLSFGLEIRFFDLNFTGRNLIKGIENIPLDVRQVPSHPDDTWIYGSRQVIRTIPENSFGKGHITSYVISASPELRAKRLRLRAGPSLAFGGFGSPSKTDNNLTHRMNQYGGSSRGTGTSLVYYSVYARVSAKPGWTAEMDFDVAKGLIVIGGLGHNYYRLLAENGYDRWDALETHQKFKLGDIKVSKTYLGLGFQPEMDKNYRPMTMFIMGGKAEPSIKLSESGRGLDVNFSDKKWLVELGFSAHIDFWSK